MIQSQEGVVETGLLSTLKLLRTSRYTTPMQPEVERRWFVCLVTVIVAGMVVPTSVEVRATPTVAVQSFDDADTVLLEDEAEAPLASNPTMMAVVAAPDTLGRLPLRNNSTIFSSNPRDALGGAFGQRLQTNESTGFVDMSNRVVPNGLKFGPQRMLLSSPASDEASFEP